MTTNTRDAAQPKVGAEISQFLEYDSPYNVLGPVLFSLWAFSFCSRLAVPLPPPLLLAISVLLATSVPTSSADDHTLWPADMPFTHSLSPPQQPMG